MTQHPKWIQKSLVFKPEVHKIFDDIEEWKDYCRFNLIAFNEADVYRSRRYCEWAEKKGKRDFKPRNYRRPHTK